MSVLCLGPPGSGKSLLLKRLQNHSVTKITVPIETVGTNLVIIPKTSGSIDDKTKKRKQDKEDGLEVREVGGSMAPLWPSYYGPSIRSILFVIDASNLFQVSISTVMLMEILSHSKLTQAKVLIVLTKVDVTVRKKINYLKFMIRLPSILEELGPRVATEEVSALTGDGIENVRSWIFKNSLPPKVATSTVRH